MSKKYIAVGAKVECDCGEGFAYLLEGTSSNVGNEAAILNTHTNKNKHFSNAFTQCNSKYNTSSNKKCTQNFDSIWFGAHESIEYSTINSSQYMQNYYDEMKACQDIVYELVRANSTYADSYEYDKTYEFTYSDLSAMMRDAKMSGYDDAKTDMSIFQSYIQQIMDLYEIESVANLPIAEGEGDLISGEDLAKIVEPNPLPQATIIVHLRLKEAQDHLNKAKEYFELLTATQYCKGNPLVEGSVLICTKYGGVISIVENGQRDDNGFLWGFTDNNQYIYYQGLKWKVYVPDQPQTKTWSDMCKNWTIIKTNSIVESEWDWAGAYVGLAIGNTPQIREEDIPGFYTEWVTEYGYSLNAAGPHQPSTGGTPRRSGTQGTFTSSPQAKGAAAVFGSVMVMSAITNCIAGGLTRNWVYLVFFIDEYGSRKVAIRVFNSDLNQFYNQPKFDTASTQDIILFSKFGPYFASQSDPMKRKENAMYCKMVLDYYGYTDAPDLYMCEKLNYQNFDILWEIDNKMHSKDNCMGYLWYDEDKNLYMTPCYFEKDYNWIGYYYEEKGLIFTSRRFQKCVNTVTEGFSEFPMSKHSVLLENWVNQYSG